MLSFKRIHDIDLTKPPYKNGKKEVPVALYSGLYHGDTCCGEVFDVMYTTDEAKGSGRAYTPTFKDDEERDAFFLQICKMVIAGIDKDGDRRQDCVNHGNYGDCIVDFFKEDSDYNYQKIRWNYFIRDRVIMLLFHKVIEANEKMREIIEFQKMKSSITGVFSDIGSYAKQTGAEQNHAQPLRKTQASMNSILGSSITTKKSKDETERYAGLLNRYFDIIIEIMKTTEHTGRDPNPLNIELCSAETELVPSAPDSEGRVRYVAKFVKPRNPDGRTMAHLLAERCPRVLMRLMVDPQIRGVFVLKYDDKDNEKYQTSTGVYVQNSKRFIPNPIAYSIPDVNGDTPRSLAIAKLTEAVATARFRDLHLVESRALEFFSSLPEPQPDRVFVEREQFIKRHMGSSKLRSAVGKLSVPEVSSGLRNMFKSDRAFKEASDMQGNLTGRQLSMITGKTPSRYSPPARNREGPANLIKSKDYVVDRDMRGFGGGKYTRKKSMNRRYGDTHKRQSRCVRRILGGRKRKNGRSGRSGRIGRIRKNTVRRYRK
jgi:hypothetical protein